MHSKSSNSRIQAYLAGPEVFHTKAIEIGRHKKDICARYGIDGLFPFDNEVSAVKGGARIDDAIYRANIEMISQADCAIVNLTPFRGPSADVGSVFELGFILGMRKVAFGYTNVVDKFPSRVEEYRSLLNEVGGKRFYDYNYMSVEEFGNVDNLMIDAGFRLQGTPIISEAVPEHLLYEDLRAFEACVKLVVERSDRIRAASRVTRHCAPGEPEARGRANAH